MKGLERKIIKDMCECVSRKQNLQGSEGLMTPMFSRKHKHVKYGHLEKKQNKT